MDTYELGIDPATQAITLYFPPEAKWEGTAISIAAEITGMLSLVGEPKFVVVDITDSHPSILNISIATYFHTRNSWINHEKLAGIFIVSKDTAVKAMASVLAKNLSATGKIIRCFDDRQEALSNIPRD